MDNRALFVVAGALVFALRCGVTSPSVSDAGPQDSGTDAGGVDGGSDAGLADSGCLPVTPKVLDCIDYDASCPPVTFVADPPASTPFRGYADPAVRKDLASSRLWATYSWAETRTLPNPDGGAAVNVDVVESHLSHSDDLGVSWLYDERLWPAYTIPDPRGGPSTGYWSSETPDFIETEDGGSVTWYGVHLRYYLKPVPGYNPEFSDWLIAVSQGPTPHALGRAPDGGYSNEQLLAAVPASGQGLPVDVVLNSLSTQLSGCLFYNNPGIYFSNGKLYIAAECMTQNLALSKIAVFSTVPVGDIQSWNWSFVGILADNTVAQELGAVELGEVDFVKGVDGQLLVLLDPAIGAGSLLNHVGCGAFELESIDPPVLRRGCDGHLIERAFVSASDEPIGPGACTYDPAMTSGIMIMRRTTPTDHTDLLHSTGLRP